MVKLSDLFHVYTGNQLDYGKQFLDNNGINFVSRNSNNNGVVGKVLVDDNISIYKKGDITVPLGGSYLLSAFVQEEHFVTAQNVAVLRPKNSNMLDIEKWFYCYALRENRFKYSAFGREVNKYLKNIKLPDEIPNWVYNTNIAPLKTKNNKTNQFLDTSSWKEFEVKKHFDICAGIYHYKSEYESGMTPYVSATNKNNGILNKIDLDPDFNGNIITTEKINCRAFYQADSFCATSDVNVYKPKFELNKYVALFVVAVINFNENYRWNYGRQCRVGDSKKITLKLPATLDHNDEFEPDWNYMERYIKSLPYGDILAELD